MSTPVPAESRSKAKYNAQPGDITFTISNEMLKAVTFAVDPSEKYIHIQYRQDKEEEAWPSPHLARRGDVLVAVDGRSTLVRKSYPRILAYLNEMRSRRAYELTFRLPQVALDAKPAISTRTQYDEASGNLEGYLNKLSKGSMFSKPKWEVRYFVLDTASRELRRYKTRANVASKKKKMVKVLSLDDVSLVTEAVDQPEVDESEEAAAQNAGSKFVTRFDLRLKIGGVSRAFIAFNPEDCRAWVSRIATITGQVKLTTEPLEDVVAAPATPEYPAIVITSPSIVSQEAHSDNKTPPPTVEAQNEDVAVAVVAATEEEKEKEKEEGKAQQAAEAPSAPSFVIVTPARRVKEPSPVPSPREGTPEVEKHSASPPQPWKASPGGDDNPLAHEGDITHAGVQGEEAKASGGEEESEEEEVEEGKAEAEADGKEEGDADADANPKTATKKKKKAAGTKTGKKKAKGEAKSPKKATATATATGKAKNTVAASVKAAPAAMTTKDLKALAREMRKGK